MKKQGRVTLLFLRIKKSLFVILSVAGNLKKRLFPKILRSNAPQNDTLRQVF